MVIILIENNTLGIFPVLNGHKVWHEAGNTALHDGIVSQNDVFWRASDTVRLVDHWNQVSQLISSAERERECLWLIVPDFPLDNCAAVKPLYPSQVSCPNHQQSKQSHLENCRDCCTSLKKISSPSKTSNILKANIWVIISFLVRGKTQYN